MRRIGSLRVFGLGLVLLLGLTACSTEQGAATDAVEESATTTDTDPSEMHTTDAGDDAQSLAAEDLSYTLEKQLGAHAVLAIEAMRQGVTGAEDFEAAAGTLATNTDDLTGSIELVYGPDAAEQFRTLWENHIGFFVEYTKGVAANDESQKQQALSQLEQYRADFGDFIEGATEGNVTADQVAELLQQHVNQLTSQVEQYAAEDYQQAYATERGAYAHMFMTAKGLAQAIQGTFPDRFAQGDMPQPQVELRSGLGQLLGEHAALAVEAMRNGVSGQPDFEASANALSGNTDDLTAAIESVYGPDAAAQFRTLWENHIGFFVQYTQGLAAGDQAQQDAALDQLAQYRADFGAFIDGATNGELPADAVADSLQTHVDQLVSQVEAYHEGDFETAYAAGYEAYQHMYATADALAEAITTSQSTS